MVRRSDNRKDQTRRLNPAIDRALRYPSDDSMRAVLGSGSRLDAAALAERVRRRATILGRHHRGQRRVIQEAHDTLMLAVYAGAALRGWSNAWSDGSCRRAQPPCGGIGGLLMEPGGKVVARIARSLASCDPFGAEITAVEAVLRTAQRHHAERLRVHTDCVALANLWRTRRHDPRLAPIRERVQALRRVDIRPIPRLHNQSAHRLARRAASGRD